MISLLIIIILFFLLNNINIATFLIFSTHDIKNLKLIKSSVSNVSTVPSNNVSDISAVGSNKECANSPLNDDCPKKKGKCSVSIVYDLLLKFMYEKEWESV